MRIWGRVTNPDGSRSWVQVTTDTSGSNDMVYITNLAQVLLLNLGESPFYANYGIPATPSIISQVFPDYYVAYTQQRFAQFFASLIVSKQPLPNPTYNINVTTHQGVKLNASIPVPV